MLIVTAEAPPRFCDGVWGQSPPNDIQGLNVRDEVPQQLKHAFLSQFRQFGTLVQCKNATDMQKNKYS